MSFDLLKQLACEFRKAIEVVVERKAYGRLTLLEHFPDGCCGYASDLLAEYLVEKGIARERIKLLNGETKEFGYTHCWIMIDDEYYVDITADQFNDKPYFRRYEPIAKCCIVPRDTYFYERFDKRKTQDSRVFGINVHGGDIPRKLQVVYDEIIRQIETESQRR